MSKVCHAFRVREIAKQRKWKNIFALRYDVYVAKRTGQQAEPPKRGRPKVGKRSDPSYIQVSAIIKRTTNDAVRMRLFTEKGEFSVLVQSLLEGWLRR